MNENKPVNTDKERSKYYGMLAERFMKRPESQIEIRKVGGKRFESPPGSCDAIIAVDVLEHISSIALPPFLERICQQCRIAILDVEISPMHDEEFWTESIMKSGFSGVLRPQMPAASWIKRGNQVFVAWH